MTLEEPAGSPASSAADETSSVAPVDPDYAFSAVRNTDGAVVMAGQVPAEATLRYADSMSGANTDAVSIAPGAPPAFGINLQAGLRALLLLDSGSLDFNAGAWRLTGIAPDLDTVAAVNAALGADAPSWTVDITVPATAPPVQASTAEPASTSAALCSDTLAAFSARNAIPFRSGSAALADGSGSALDELAADLAQCPDAPIHVEGHTDADGDEALNLALSVARAEAVVAALIQRGVASQRLYALGFGEMTPIASNDTPEGKSQNRRIVIKLAPADAPAL